MDRLTTLAVLALCVAVLWLFHWSTLFILLLMFVLSHMIWNHVMNQPDKSCDLPLPPGSMGFPLIGQTVEFLWKKGDLLDPEELKTKEILKSHLFGTPTVILLAEDRISKVFLNKDDAFTSVWPGSVSKLVGTRVGASQTMGETHKMYRRLYNRVFTPENLQSLLSKISETVESTLKEWISLGDIKVYEQAYELAFSVAYHCLLGLPPDVALNKRMMDTYRLFDEGLFSVPINFPGTKFYKGLKAKNDLYSLMKPYLIQNRSKLDPDSTIYHMISCSGECDLNLTDQDILDLALELSFAGHVTNASMMTSIALALCQHPEVKEKLEEELQEHGLLENSEILDDYRALKELSYLDNFIKECLFHNPPVRGGFRKTTKTVCFKDYQIPKDWMVAYSIHAAHTKFLGDNPQFEPSRWDKTDQSGQMLRRPSILTFGGGNRLCSGKDFGLLALKCFTVYLLRMCDLHLKNPDVKMVYIPVRHPEDGLPVKITAKQRK